MAQGSYLSAVPSDDRRNTRAENNQTDTCSGINRRRRKSPLGQPLKIRILAANVQSVLDVKTAEEYCCGAAQSL